MDKKQKATEESEKKSSNSDSDGFTDLTETEFQDMLRRLSSLDE